MKRPGFTFIELLVALTLFSVGMISILEVFPINKRLITENGMQSQAVFLAQEEIENIRAIPYSSMTVGTYEPTEAPPDSTGTVFSEFQRTTTINYIDSSYAITATDTGLKIITVVVTWSDHAVAHTYTLNTYAYDK